MAFPFKPSSVRQTRLVDGQALGGIHVVQEIYCVINYERVHCDIEGPRLLH